MRYVVLIEQSWECDFEEPRCSILDTELPPREVLDRYAIEDLMMTVIGVIPVAPGTTVDILDDTDNKDPFKGNALRTVCVDTLPRFEEAYAKRLKELREPLDPKTRFC